MDCVLVDTAGRMQNNGPLMQQLAKLVAVNRPDLVLMVAEALVGSDGACARACVFAAPQPPSRRCRVVAD